MLKTCSRTGNQKSEFAEEFRKIHDIHEERMLETVDNEEFTAEDFKKLFKNLQTKDKEKYKLILKAWEDFKCILFSLFKAVWNSEKKPSLWRNTDIVN